jgi:hypothetical protein
MTQSGKSESAYSYCETATAGPMPPWHIRSRPVNEPLRIGGGIRQEALCGRDLGRGWDIGGREVTVEDIQRLARAVCPGCAQAYTDSHQGLS